MVSLKDLKQQNLTSSEFQWGHDPEVMVRLHPPNNGGRNVPVSMGPRPGGHGKADKKISAEGHQIVSMGPRPGGHGKER